MIFRIPRLIEHISSIMTLEVGTLFPYLSLLLSVWLSIALLLMEIYD
jgi:hypothetical protein